MGCAVKKGHLTHSRAGPIGPIWVPAPDRAPHHGLNGRVKPRHPTSGAETAGIEHEFKLGAVHGLGGRGQASGDTGHGAAGVNTPE